jgi:putative acetyltransferase
MSNQPRSGARLEPSRHGKTKRPEFRLRPYTPADEAATIELWRQSWQNAYPLIDFAARLTWFTQHWCTELVPHTRVIIAEVEGHIAGFVTVDAAGYVDQFVVAPQLWGHGIAKALLVDAKRLSPSFLSLHVNVDNSRAIAFYRKHGFAVAGEGINPRSGAAVYRMCWHAGAQQERPVG